MEKKKKKIKGGFHPVYFAHLLTVHCCKDNTTHLRTETGATTNLKLVSVFDS